MLKLHDLSKVYRTDEVETVALDEVNIEISQGEFVAEWHLHVKHELAMQHHDKVDRRHQRQHPPPIGRTVLVSRRLARVAHTGTRITTPGDR